MQSQSKNKDNTTMAILFIGVVLVALIVGYLLGFYQASSQIHGNLPTFPSIPDGPGSGIACPEDARTCSDGTVVVRVAPNCEFAACPTTTAQ